MEEYKTVRVEEANEFTGGARYEVQGARCGVSSEVQVYSPTLPSICLTDLKMLGICPVNDTDNADKYGSEIKKSAKISLIRVIREPSIFIFRWYFLNRRYNESNKKWLLALLASHIYSALA